MNFDIINNLYTQKSSKWILMIEENEIEPFLIQRFLAMNDSIRVQTRWLDKYTFNIPPKMYLSLAWSVLPKTTNTPFVKYIKQVQLEDELHFILKEVRKFFNMSDNDFEQCKPGLISTIKNDMETWFMFCGIEKKYWKKYKLDWKKISLETKTTPNNLSQWW